MRRLWLISTLTLMVITRCGQVAENTQSTAEVESEFSPTIEIREFSEDDSDCEANCTSVKVQYDVIAESKRFNDAIEQKVTEQLQNFVSDGEQLSGIEALTNAFVADYREFKEAFPQSSTPWELTITGSLNYASSTLVSYEIVINSYTGGAHPNSETLILNMDLNGADVLMNAITADRSGLLQLAERAFRSEKALKPNDDFAKAGYIFEDNKFQLPQNIGLTEKGLLLYYNDYEIASHASGPTRLVIPFDQLEGIIER